MGLLKMQTSEFLKNSEVFYGRDFIYSLGACRREKKLPELPVGIVKSKLKQGINSLEIARFGNLAKLKDAFSSLSDSLLGFPNG